MNSRILLSARDLNSSNDDTSESAILPCPLDSLGDSTTNALIPSSSAASSAAAPSSSCAAAAGGVQSALASQLFSCPPWVFSCRDFEMAPRPDPDTQHSGAALWSYSVRSELFCWKWRCDFSSAVVDPYWGTHPVSLPFLFKQRERLSKASKESTGRTPKMELRERGPSRISKQATRRRSAMQFSWKSMRHSTQQ